VCSATLQACPCHWTKVYKTTLCVQRPFRPVPVIGLMFTKPLCVFSNPSSFEMYGRKRTEPQSRRYIQKYTERCYLAWYTTGDDIPKYVEISSSVMNGFVLSFLTLTLTNIESYFYCRSKHFRIPRWLICLTRD